jgi:hypothetical protein
MANRNDAATAAIHRHQKTRSASPSPTRQPASHQASPKRTARRSPHTTRTRRHAPPCSARAKNCGAVHTSTRPLTQQPSQQANPCPPSASRQERARHSRSPTAGSRRAARHTKTPRSRVEGHPMSDLGHEMSWSAANPPRRALGRPTSTEKRARPLAFTRTRKRPAGSLT